MAARFMISEIYSKKFIPLLVNNRKPPVHLRKRSGNRRIYPEKKSDYKNE